MRRDRGVTLLELLVVVAILSVLMALTLGAVQRVRSAAARVTCANNLRQVGLGLHQHHSATGVLPPGVRVYADKTKMPFASWITRILPYLGEEPAWAEAVADYAKLPDFGGLNPHRNLARPLPVVLCPLAPHAVGTTDENTTAAFTYYLGISGKNGITPTGVLFPDSAVRFGQITDGLSQTLIAGERPPSPDNHFGWWYAGIGQLHDGSADYLLGVRDGNRTFRAPTCPKGPYHFQPGDLDDMCSTFHYWSLHSGGAHFLFCDGSVRFLRYAADEALPALASRAGGEVVPEFE